ncbi:MAG: hypothetical protein H6737_23150 [Alphaproteobacteria bacterium]|nr:hypothetical protein [Alphaproteobacteria bacterium]
MASIEIMPFPFVEPTLADLCVSTQPAAGISPSRNETAHHETRLERQRRAGRPEHDARRGTPSERPPPSAERRSALDEDRNAHIAVGCGYRHDELDAVTAAPRGLLDTRGEGCVKPEARARECQCNPCRGMDDQTQA